jgi:hypothetical protein
MSEHLPNAELKPKDPELLKSQEFIKSLSESILEYKKYSALTFADLLTSVTADEVYNKLLASSIGEIMLKDGESLSASKVNDRYPELGLIIGKAELVAVNLRAWGWYDDKHRIDKNGPDTPPYDIIDYPGEKDWIHQLDISFWYSNGKTEAQQTLSAYTSSLSAGRLPTLTRDVYAPAYFETGYEGHNMVNKQVQNENEVFEFVNIAQKLFDNRII